jgi:hypothetical protein
MSYRSFHAEHVRLVTLRIVAMGSGVANDRVIRSGLDHWGLVVSLEDISAHLDWLRERKLVEVRDIPGAEPPVRRVSITAAGREVAEGRTAVDGVARTTGAPGA